jgi:hypothetical protein
MAIDAPDEWLDSAVTTTDGRPLVSILIEGFTPTEHAARHLAVPDPVQTLDAVQAQLVGQAAEIVVITCPESLGDLQQRLVGRAGVRVIESAEHTYYALKTDAVSQLDTPYVAFVDGDCMPGPRWVHEMLASMRAGADVVAGPVDYPPGPMSRTMGYFDFGGVMQGDDGQATNFFANNVAFRREILVANPFEDRLRRSGGCYLMTRRLKAAGYGIEFNRAMSCVHGASYRKKGWLNHRLRNGHDAVNLRKVDDTHVLPSPWLARLGVFGAPFIVAGRIRNDWVRTVRSRRDLGLSWPLVPWLWLVSIPLRTIEGVAYVVSCIDPGVIGKYWG